MAVLLIVALSIEDIRKVFETRASLEQSYDVGTTGRFGDQLRSIPMLFDLPDRLRSNAVLHRLSRRSAITSM